MINFSIPGTGSSGHLGGGMLLAVLLGPYAGFLTVASILLIQALFFGTVDCLPTAAMYSIWAFSPVLYPIPVSINGLPERA